MNENCIEEWKDIVGYEGLYQVSNLGNVKSIDRINRIGRHVPERILAQSNTTSGYLNVNLSKDGIARVYQVHRLVATAFIENSDNKPQVDHIDNNKHNNNANNLRWVTEKENMGNPITRETLLNRPKRTLSEEHKEKIGKSLLGRQYSESTIEKIRKAHIGKQHTEETKRRISRKNSVSVICLDDKKIFKSIKEASIYYNVDQTGIVRVCKGKLKAVKGFHFSYYEDYKTKNISEDYI